MSRSALASPGGSTALSDRCTVLLTFVYAPVFSPQPAAGRTTSASRAVSVRNASWTTTKQLSPSRILRTRGRSGRLTAGVVGEVHNSPIDPPPAYPPIFIAWGGGGQCGGTPGSPLPTPPR